MQVRKVKLRQRELLVFQDDLLHPVLGGNKLRKLDALLPELKTSQYTDLASEPDCCSFSTSLVQCKADPGRFNLTVCLQLTCGGVQSAHTAAVAAACAEQGIRAHLLVRGERPAVPTGYHLLTRMYGNVMYVTRSEYADRQAMMTKYAQQLQKEAPTDMQVCMHGHYL